MIRPVTFFAALAFVGSGLWLYQTKHNAQMLDRDIDRTLRAVDEARNRAGLLRADYTLLNDPSRLQDLADQFLTLRPTAPTQFTTMAELAKRLPPVQLPAPPETTTDTPPADEPVADAPVAAVAPPPSVVAPKAAPHPPVVVAAARPAPRPARPAPTPLLPAAAPSRVVEPPARVAQVPPPTPMPRAIPVAAPAPRPAPVFVSALGMARQMNLAQPSLQPASMTDRGPLTGGGR
jgi:hypothetical protein